MSDRHSYMHPVFRGILNAIAPAAAEPLGTAPLTLEAQQATIRRLAQSIRNPALHAYQQLVEAIATEAQGKDWTDPKHLPALTNAQRATILRGAPDVLNDLEVVAEELAEVFEGDADARLWLSTRVEPLLRRWLFLDVCAELEADAQTLDESARDPELRKADFL